MNTTKKSKTATTTATTTKKKRAKRIGTQSLDDGASDAVVAWLAALRVQPSDADIDAACSNIDIASVTVAVLKTKLAAYNAAELKRFVDGHAPRVCLPITKKQHWRTSEVAALRVLLTTMKRTTNQLMAPFINKFNDERRALGVELVTYAQMSKKCLKMREKTRSVRSGEPFVWPTNEGARRACVFVAQPLSIDRLTIV